MERILEPEVMDSLEESLAYDKMDFTEVNQAFVNEAIAQCDLDVALVLDIGTGPGRIPVMMAQSRPQWRIIAIDMAETMLAIARQHVFKAGLTAQISLELADAKNLPYPDGYFDLVISNSLVHHLPEPKLFFEQVKRVVKPNGGLLIRDLFRPGDRETINQLVNSIGQEYDPHQVKLFRDSLHAALTLNEVREIVESVGLTGVKIVQSSDRHWSISRSGSDFRF
ncbi:class I SAM-dependent methyltransferase [Calothrix sp. NIES-3974]|uniref:class I SAM-dependent methyltransferase n=1 Tax=Calothrix sp. NIES-3974 TaxID=2005462 RepID=UPI000B5E01B9|nr:class I SAM-dependent methyltransferase [Calothrix sp. NIES-3974]BAZ05273.1 UbiE/COQ5 methyltransferase [Calothrix sp. NIES-3974]